MPMQTADPPNENVAPPSGHPAAGEMAGFTAPPANAAVVAPTSVEFERFSAAANALGFDIYGKLRGNEGNLFFSPASIEIAFAMTASGARTATATEMNRVLHVGGSPDAFHQSAGRILTGMNAPHVDYELAVVNRLFGEQTYRFEAPFLAMTRDTYRAPFEPMDFVGAAEPGRLRINRWVATQTNDRIRDLLPPASLDAFTRLVLVNAVYFLGKWERPFATSRTQPGYFYVGGTDRQTTPMMHLTARFQYAENDGVQVFEMPYQGGELAMTILLPRDRNGLVALESGLDAGKLTRLTRGLHAQEIAVSLPKFKIENARIPLSAVMQDLGMRLAFSSDGADFTGIGNPPNSDQRLFISNAFHEAFIKVDEEGTEAAAATAVVMATRGAMPAPPTEVVVDHPFVFLIRDTRTHTVLFLGRVSDPR